MRRIILASSSPRRKELMKQLFGANFEIVHSQYDEDNSLQLEPAELVKFHALSKARDVAEKAKSGVVIGVDTVVCYDGKILGKPADEADALRMLQLISGKVVKVVSGLAVIDTDNNLELQESETTDVAMKNMADDELRSYIKTGEPLDKAGAFAIQGKGAALVESISGSYSNVVGLPLSKLSKMLEQLGVDVPE